MRKLLLAAALLWAAPVNAAVLTYDYQGQPIPGWYGVVWTGHLVIDEALLPSGTILNASLDWSWSGYVGNLPQPTFFNQPAAIVSASYGPILYDIATLGLINPGGPGVMRGWFTISFDAFGHITSWHGIAALGYGFDPYTHNGIDSMGGISSQTAGIWTGGPAPVPLPPALLLFGSALGLTVFANRWRRRRLSISESFASHD